MKTPFDLVKEFHHAFNHPSPKEITVLSPELLQLRFKLIFEELNELSAEFGYELKAELISNTSFDNSKLDIANIGKELADILYVINGFADNMGLPMNEIFKEVHRSNMSKLDDDGKPVYRPDGKILKGNNYSPADIKTVLDTYFNKIPLSEAPKPSIDAFMSIVRFEDDDDYEEVEDRLIDTWKHGTEHQLIIKRISDNTLWAIIYRKDNYGDYNELRDGDLDSSYINRVFPKERTITDYVSVRPTK